jgi:hypothetical protein
MSDTLEGYFEIVIFQGTISSRTGDGISEKDFVSTTLTNAVGTSSSR